MFLQSRAFSWTILSNSFDLVKKAVVQEWTQSIKNGSMSIIMTDSNSATSKTPIDSDLSNWAISIKS